MLLAVEIRTFAELLMCHLNTIFVQSKRVMPTIEFARTVGTAFYEQTYVLNTFIRDRL